MDFQYIVLNNPIILSDRARMKGLFSDIFQNDAKKVNALMAGFDIGILKDMIDNYPVTSVAKGGYIKRITQQYPFEDRTASWIVDTFEQCLSKEIIQKLKVAEREKEAEEKKKAKQVANEAKPVSETSQLSDSELLGNTENAFINPKLPVADNRVFIPCGFGETDKGFFICGIKKTVFCSHPSRNIYALVYNILVRNTNIQDQDFPQELEDEYRAVAIDYKSIFRLSILLLQLIRHDYVSGNTISIDFSGGSDIVRASEMLINHYAILFSRIIGIDAPTINIVINRNGIKVSLTEKKGIHIENNTEFSTNARELWYGERINYRLTRDKLHDVELLLSELAVFDSLREGQFDALSNMMSAKGNSVCIMPTGSGKSLIYYLAAFLQPLPILVVSPTDILIKDQIRNLRVFHRVDNVSQWQLSPSNDFSNFRLCNSINYITPIDLQNRNLLVEFRYINNGTRLKGYNEEPIAHGPLMSYVVLDEIHCLSNWGHDFRPEYLMLSHYLSKLLTQVRIWGFTATANYSVVDDIQKQLTIPEENFFSPIPLEKNNISYHFQRASSTEEMYEVIESISHKLIDRGERTLIFTKSDLISEKVADRVGYEADVFSSDNPEAYQQFAAGKCSVLIASESLGIGVNLPNVHNVIHFGLPLSKAEYVQEIGRAGRNYEKAASYVIYLSSDAAPAGLLQRNTPIDDLPSLVYGISNDYEDVFRLITNNSSDSGKMLERLLDFYGGIDYHTKAVFHPKYQKDILAEAKQNIYYLYCLGYVREWYASTVDRKTGSVEMVIDVCSVDYQTYLNDPNYMLSRMKQAARDYYDFLGKNREHIFKTNRAKSPEEIMKIYVDWYYRAYLYRHNEEFLDVYEFISGGHEKVADELSREIETYFSLPFVQLKNDEAYFNDLSVQAIIKKALSGLKQSTVSNVERINTNHYSYKLDLLLFCSHLLRDNQFEESRLRRIMERAPAGEIPGKTNLLRLLYPACATSGRFLILKHLDSEDNPGAIKAFCESIYKDMPKDLIYFGVLARTINAIFLKQEI